MPSVIFYYSKHGLISLGPVTK